MEQKQLAYDFLLDLREHLTKTLLNPNAIKARISEICSKPEKDETEKLGPKENIFLYHFALPEIVNYMKSVTGIDDAIVKQSLRGEYYSKFPHLFCGNTRRKQGHPFSKDYPFENNLEEKLSSIMQRWKTPKTGSGYSINESYPDLCITEPFPFKIVFDAKYEDEKLTNLTSAERKLVSGVYEVVHYRGQPLASPKYAGVTQWGYDYGCLLAYDASQSGYLQQAWNSVVSKHLFWEDANVFVMIVQGQRINVA